MAISWAEGLLAGAAGVGEYALQQQAKLDARQQRVQELRDNMNMYKAKSRYALDLKEYEKSRSLNKNLTSVEAGGFDEQFMLYSNLGYSDAQANALATRAMKSGRKLERPGEAEVPKFLGNLDEEPRNRTQSWARNFVGKVLPGQMDESTQTRVPDQTQFQQEPTQEDIQDPGLTAPRPGPEDTQTLSYEVPEGDPEFTSPFAAPVKWDTKFQVLDLGGKRTLTAQKSNDLGETEFEVVMELGDEFGTEVAEIQNGDMIDIYAVRNDGTYKKVDSVPAAARVSKASGDKPVQGTSVSTAEVDRFVNEDNDLGGFNSIFKPFQEAEKAWIDGTDVSNPEQVSRDLGMQYLTYMKNISKTRTAQDAAKYGAQDNRDAQGHAYATTMEATDIAKMIDSQPELVDPRIFKNVGVDNLNQIIRNLTKIDSKSPILKELTSYRNLALASAEVSF